MLDAAAAGGLYDGAHRLDAAAMAFDAGQKTVLRPAAVAVHDDCKVVGMRHWQSESEKTNEKSARNARLGRPRPDALRLEHLSSAVLAET